MKVGSILYLPPPTAYTSATAILENLSRFPPKHELLVYSDHDYGIPGQIRLKLSPEVARQVDGVARMGKQDFRVNNAIYITGMQLARAAGFTHVIYVEADCRVGRPGWDDVIFDEYFNIGRPCVVAGSLAFYNPCNSGEKGMQRWQQIVARNTTRNFPCPTYGWVGAADAHPSCVFPNGALSVMDMAWIKRLYTLENAIAEAVSIGPWDMATGQKLWEIFAEDAYEVTAHLGCIYSSYGDVITTEEQRLQMLRDGTVVGVHQVKSAAQP